MGREASSDAGVDGRPEFPSAPARRNRMSRSHCGEDRMRRAAREMMNFASTRAGPTAGGGLPMDETRRLTEGALSVREFHAPADPCPGCPRPRLRTVPIPARFRRGEEFAERSLRRHPGAGISTRPSSAVSPKDPDPSECDIRTIASGRAPPQTARRIRGGEA